MEIAIASHDLYPDPGSGGTGRYVYEIARELAARGHSVDVVTRRRGDGPRRERMAGFEVYRYDVAIADRPATAILPRIPAARAAVADHARELDPDVVSYQGPVTSLLLDGLLDPAVPRSCTFHSPWPAEYRLRTRADDTAGWRRRFNAWLRGRLERHLLGRVDEVVTLSDYMHDELLARYAPEATTAVVPGGVDAERFSPDAGPFGPIDTAGLAFLTVRRLSPRMGHDLLLEAFAMVRERRPDTELFIAGDGPLRDRLQARAAALGVADHTTFLGYVPDAALPAAYASADVFVLPTTALEGFGLATLEALAAGTPVVGTPVGGTVELLGTIQAGASIPEAMLVDEPSAGALAERMLAWASLPPTVRAEAALASRRFVARRYPWTRTVDALERRYRGLAGHG